jgi:peptidoglycan/LPS O-acetylase OafA/YrhL
MGGAGRSSIFESDRYVHHVFTVSDLVNFHILLLAVPSFVLVSTFLYTARGATPARLRRHLLRFTTLAVFWGVTFNVYRAGWGGLRASFPASWVTFTMAILTAGHTIYYFFISLSVSQVVAHWAAARSRALQVLGLVLSTVLIGCLPVLARITGYGVLSAYWNPLNFLPYAFAGVLLAQNRETVRSRKRLLVVIAMAAYVPLAILEWHYGVHPVFFPVEGYAFPTYARASLVFSVTALGMIVLEARVRATGGVRFMAKYSLALYCLHPFLMDPVKAWVVNRLSGNSVSATYLAIVLVILLSYVLARVLRIVLKEEIVT